MVPRTIAAVGILVLMSPLLAHAESLSKPSQAVAKGSVVAESCGGKADNRRSGRVRASCL